MMLTSEQIFGLIQKGAVQPSPVTSPEEIESDLLDLTLDAILLVKGKGESKRYDERILLGHSKPEVFFGITKRRVPPQVELPWTKNEYDNFEATCDPGYAYCFRSVEVFCLPKTVKAEAVNRSSVTRSGGGIDGTYIPYGYEGKIFVRFSIPLYGAAFTWERGARFCSTAWHAMSNGMTAAYDGIWTGDKAHTDGEERAY